MLFIHDPDTDWAPVGMPKSDSWRGASGDTATGGQAHTSDRIEIDELRAAGPLTPRPPVACWTNSTYLGKYSSLLVSAGLLTAP